MRILKKSLSLLLAIAVIASLIVVNVSAASPVSVVIDVEVDKTAVGQGQKFVATVYYTLQGAGDEEEFETGTAGWVLNYPANEVTVVDKADEIDLRAKPNRNMAEVASKIVLAKNGAVYPVAKTAVAKFEFTFDADATVGDFEFTISNTGFTDYEGNTMDVTFNAPTITVAETAVINSVTAPAAIADKALGTAVADLGLPSTVVVATATKESPVGQNVNVAWDTAAYDATSLADQTFTGTVTTGSDAWTLAGDFVAPTITVTLQPLTAGDITADIASVIEIPAEKEAREVTNEELLALVEGVVYTITSGDFTDTIEGTAAVTENAIDITDVDTTATITVTFAAETASTAGKFVLAEADTVTFTVDVVPAEIEGCTIEIKNTTANAKPTVKATIPANEVVGEAAVSVEFLKPVTVEETTTWEVVDTFEATATAVADEATVVEVKADATLDEMGFKNAGDVFAVKVLVNGATLLVDGAEQVESEVMLTFAGESVGGIGVSQGSVKLPEKTEEPGTDEPGTDEPGTDAPGTDEPGTDEPGTDAPAVEGPFADVAADHWAASFIAALKDAGIIGGVNDTDFAPDNNITRAEYAKMIAGAFGLEATSAEVAFADCTADDWFTPFVAACVEAGYINGVSETEFAPNENITREQACAILGRALNVAGEGELTFTDVAEVEEYAKAFVAALAEMGIVNGYEDGTFAPKNNITRAEAAKIIAGVLAAQTEEAPFEEAPAAE